MQLNLHNALAINSAMLLVAMSAHAVQVPDHPLQPSASPGWRIVAKPIGLSETEVQNHIEALLRSSRVKEVLGEALGTNRARVLSAEFSDTGTGAGTSTETLRPTFDLRLYDYTQNRLWSVSGDRLDVENLRIAERNTQIESPAPTPEEFMESVRIIGEDRVLGAELKAARLQPYQAMPPLIKSGTTKADGCHRIIAIGLQPLKPSARHEIVGVNLSTRSLLRYATYAPPAALATAEGCGPTDAKQPNTFRGMPGHAEVTAQWNGETIWQMKVTRPAASAGFWGSGIEISDVSYKGRKVLAKVHSPIMNVDYLNNACGPFRDWMYAENPFNAQGERTAWGILQAASKPTTIFESKVDRGNFRGVAYYIDGDDIVFVTELAAAWYRYVSEYRFSRDGTIRPIFRFGSVFNSCVCRTHFHHVYWRFDFDIDGEKNTVQVLANTSRGARWRTVQSEEKQLRGAGKRRSWRVLDRSLRAGYVISPGPRDGTANSFGSGDVWILRKSIFEFDDLLVYRGQKANLDAFLTNESVVDRDVVVWYGAHLTHTHDSNSETQWLGPTLRPIGF